MLLRLAYLGITNAFALLRLLAGNYGDRDAEILALRHQLAVLHRQPGRQRVRFEPADRLSGRQVADLGTVDVSGRSGSWSDGHEPQPGRRDGPIRSGSRSVAGRLRQRSSRAG